MYKQYSSIRIRAVIYERDTNGDYELDTNGDKIVEQYLNYPATNSEYLIEVKEDFAKIVISPILNLFIQNFKYFYGEDTNGDPLLTDTEVKDIIAYTTKYYGISCQWLCGEGFDGQEIPEEPEA